MDFKKGDNYPDRALHYNNYKKINKIQISKYQFMMWLDFGVYLYKI